MFAEQFFYLLEGDYYRTDALHQDAQRYVIGRGFVSCDAVMVHYRARVITKAEFQQGITRQLRKAS